MPNPFLMQFKMDGPALLDVCVLAACWVGFGVILVIGKRGATKTDAKRSPISHLGFLLQLLGYAICFAFPRPDLSPIVPMPKVTELLLSGVIAAMGVISIGICYAAARALGKQWALVARVVDDHELITAGPYSHVRNPIYLAMFGMLVATGLDDKPLAGVAGGYSGVSHRKRDSDSQRREAFARNFRFEI